MAALSPEQWDDLSAMAAQHRLGPLLHAGLGVSPAIPEEHRAEWRASHRFWSCNAMAHRQDLTDCVQTLEAHGFAPIALKGAFLAWFAYPDPALRPLRDLDILVGTERAQQAFETLKAEGYVPEMVDEYGHANGLHPAATKHLAPLVAPRGSVIELHRRLWESDGTLDHRLPAFAEDAIRARAVVVEGIAFPAAEDMLVHLIVHAVYSHRLDCGPLLLWDIRHLVERCPVDWDRLWQRAQVEGWDRGAALVLAILRQVFGDAAVPRSHGEPPAPPQELTDVALDLLLQDLSTRQSAGVAASGIALGRRGLGERLTRGRARAAGSASRPIGAVGNFLSWAVPRARRTATELGRRTVRRQAKELAELSLWLGT